MAKEELFVIQEDDAGNAKGFALSEIRAIAYELRSSGGDPDIPPVQVLFIDTGSNSPQTFNGKEAEALYKELKKLAIVV